MGEAIDFAIFLVPLLGVGWMTFRAARKAGSVSPRADTDVVGRRVVAHVLDWILIGLTWTCALSTSYHLALWIGWLDSTRLVFDNIANAYGFTAATIADFVILQAFTGYTLGKLALGIRTVDEDRRRPGLWRTVVRSVPLVFEQIGIVALFAMARSPEHQRFGDRWAHTYVVSTRPRKARPAAAQGSRREVAADDPRALWR